MLKFNNLVELKMELQKQYLNMIETKNHINLKFVFCKNFDYEGDFVGYSLGHVTNEMLTMPTEYCSFNPDINYYFSNENIDNKKNEYHTCLSNRDLFKPCNCVLPNNEEVINKIITEQIEKCIKFITDYFKK